MNSMEFKSKLSWVGQQTYFGKALAAKIEKFYSFGEVLMLIYDDIQDGRLQVEWKPCLGGFIPYLWKVISGLQVDSQTSFWEVISVLETWGEEQKFLSLIRWWKSLVLIQLGESESRLWRTFPFLQLAKDKAGIVLKGHLGETKEGRTSFTVGKRCSLSCGFLHNLGINLKLKDIPERKREDMLLIIQNAALVLGQQMISCWGCGLATKLPP